MMFFIVLKFGVERIKLFFLLVVVGFIIMVIGLRFSLVVLSMVGYSNNIFDRDSLIIVLIVVISMIFISILKKLFFRLVLILILVVIGYIVVYFMGDVDLFKIYEVSWIGLLEGVWDIIIIVFKFIFLGVVVFVLIVLVVFIEYIGDIIINGVVVGKDFFKNLGVYRILLGDGIVIMVVGFLGGFVNIIYGENIGVFVVIKVYNFVILRIVVCFVIVLGFIGKFGVIF